MTRVYVCEYCEGRVDEFMKFCPHCGSLFNSNVEVKQALKHKDTLGAGAKERRKLKTEKDVWEAVMKEFKRGTLHAGNGKIVTDIKQAKAIALSETKRFRK